MSKRLARPFALTAGRSSAYHLPKHFKGHQTSHQLNNGKPSQAARRSLLSQVINTFKVLVETHPIPKERPWTCPVCGSTVFPNNDQWNERMRDV